MKQKHVWKYRVGVGAGHPDVPPLPAAITDPPPPQPSDDPAQEALRRTQYELDASRAELTRIRREMEALRTQVPSDEQMRRLQELEQQAQAAEEQRRRKEGEFDAWRTQIEQRHRQDLEARDQAIAAERARADAREREVNDMLVGQAFLSATSLFGPTGKTVMLADMAQRYFAPNVEVQITELANGRIDRRVVVKDYNGAVIVDTKTGRPAAFVDAMNELIELHPQKASLLRGTGKVGSGSSGGAGGVEDINLARLRTRDFDDPEIRDRVRQSLRAPGAISVGPAFDRMEEAARRRKP